MRQPQGLVEVALFPIAQNPDVHICGIMKRRRGAGNPISTGQKKILGGRHALVHDSGVLTPDSSVIKDSLCAVSRQLGFSGCRVARAEKSPFEVELCIANPQMIKVINETAQ